MPGLRYSGVDTSGWYLPHFTGTELAEVQPGGLTTYDLTGLFGQQLNFSYDPSTLFARGQKGGVWDWTDMSKLFQDSAGVTPVTASGQTIGRALDFSGNGQHAIQATPASRPLFITTGGNHAAYDGVDDNMVIALDLSGQSVYTILVGAESTNVLANHVLYEMEVLLANGWFGMHRSLLAAGDIATFLTGTTFGFRYSNALQPAKVVVHTVLRIADTGTPITAINPAIAYPGSIGFPNQLANPPNGTTFFNDNLHVGSRAGTSLFLNGKMYRLLIREGELTGTDLTDALAWVAAGAGVTI